MSPVSRCEHCLFHKSTPVRMNHVHNTDDDSLGLKILEPSSPNDLPCWIPGEPDSNNNNRINLVHYWLLYPQQRWTIVVEIKVSLVFYKTFYAISCVKNEILDVHKSKGSISEVLLECNRSFGWTKHPQIYLCLNIENTEGEVFWHPAILTSERKVERHCSIRTFLLWVHAALVRWCALDIQVSCSLIS